MPTQTNDEVTELLDRLDTVAEGQKEKINNEFYLGIVHACSLLNSMHNCSVYVKDVISQCSIDWDNLAPHCAEYDLRYIRAENLFIPLGGDFGNEFLPGHLELAWAHPSYPDWWDEGTDSDERDAFYDAHKLEHIRRDLLDEPDDVQEAFDEDFDKALSGFNPTPPEGEGWILWAIYDTEDESLICEWVRRHD